LIAPGALARTEAARDLVGQVISPNSGMVI
jgi:hypothetical protein